MTKILPLTRRSILTAIAALSATAPAWSQSPSVLDASELGLVGDTGADQTALLQGALDAAASAGQILRLPGGTIAVTNLAFPSNLVVEGVPGRTILIAPSGSSIGAVKNANALVLRDVGFASSGAPSSDAALLSIEASDDIVLERCQFRDAGATGLAIFDAGVTIRDCRFSDMGDAAVHALNSRGLLITGNRIQACGNAGLRIWRSESGADGSIISGNHIANIDWRSGGNGQSGNGINVFRADEVIVADNHIADCAFSAVRLNSTNNTQVSGNTCLRSGETAIYSEFAFSGSIIANNIVDGAATGISITNLNDGGQLAVCSGNIVRNITPSSAVNPDSGPTGIYAEADTAITGNTVQNVPGTAIAAGYGPFLRNVLIASNVISQTIVGINVSVAEGAGAVHIGANAMRDVASPMIGTAWDDIVEPDLAANADRHANVTLAAL